MGYLNKDLSGSLHCQDHLGPYLCCLGSPQLSLIVGVRVTNLGFVEIMFQDQTWIAIQFVNFVESMVPSPCCKILFGTLCMYNYLNIKEMILHARAGTRIPGSGLWWSQFILVATLMRHAIQIPNGILQ